MLQCLKTNEKEGLDMPVLTLPFPPSANRIWRVSNGRTHRSADYVKWEKKAEASFTNQKNHCGTPVSGGFVYHILLDETRRAVARDGDNRQKAVLDFLQHVGLIDDDKFANGGSWSWGPTEKDCCVVSVYANKGGSNDAK